MNKNTLTITLKQHTPIIHFQHAQPGATLRATEVKPKLDRFIINKFKALFPDREDLYSHLEKFKPSEKIKSPYKISIFDRGEKGKKYLIASNLDDSQIDFLGKEANDISFLPKTLYFAQEEPIREKFFKSMIVGEQPHPTKPKKKIPKYDILKKDDNSLPIWALQNQEKDDKEKMIKINFFSFDSKVIEIITLIVSYFFLYENFGTRQNKGFGCFTVFDPKPEKSIEEMLRGIYEFRYKKTVTNSLKKAFEEIQYDYRLLKSGHNFPQYRKSLLFLYYVQGGITRWEKRRIKQLIRQNRISGEDLKVNKEAGNSSVYGAGRNEQSWIDSQKFQYEYIRAILGLAEQYEFQTDPGYDKARYVVKMESLQGVDRFKSPIVFKIIDQVIYLLANPLRDGNSEDSILNKEFLLKYGLKTKSNTKPELSDLGKEDKDKKMKTPQHFNLGEFLNYALVNAPDKVKIKDYVNF